MICPKCGVQMPEGSNICIRCGTITYGNKIRLDGSKNNSINQTIEINPNIEKPTFISNNIYHDIHDDKTVKFQKILNIYLSFFLAFWCVAAIIKSIRLNMSIADVLIYGTAIILHIMAKKSVEKKSKPAGFVSIFLAILMIIITFKLSIVNIIFCIFGIFWIFCAIEYLIKIDKRRNKIILILSIIATILSPIIFLVLIGLFVTMNK